MKKIFLFTLTVVLFSNLSAQDVIHLTNPSFEDRPHIGQLDGPAPRGWHDSGPPGETTVDVQPSPNPDEPFFYVTQQAQHGKTYMGMVARDNATWEAVGQRLKQPLSKGTAYRFSVYASKSDILMSVSRRTNQPTNFKKALALRVWAGNSFFDRFQLLGKTVAVDHEDWKEYVFEFKSKRNFKYIILEAFYDTPVLFEYNGNLLIDNCSDIVQIDLEDFDEAASAEKVSPNNNKTASPSRLHSVFSDSTQKVTLEKVSTLAGNCFEQDITESVNGEPLTHVLFLNNLLYFKNKLDANGMQQFVVSEPYSKLTLAIRSFENIGAKESVKILKELTRIYNKNKNSGNLTEDESNYFESGSALYKEVATKEDLNALMEAYVQRNLEALKLELRHCN